MSRNEKIKWAAWGAVVLFWLAVVADVVPRQNVLMDVLIDAEVWLTNTVADPILLAFASGLLISALVFGDYAGLVRRVAKAVRRPEATVRTEPTVPALRPIPAPTPSPRLAPAPAQEAPTAPPRKGTPDPFRILPDSAAEAVSAPLAAAPVAAFDVVAAPPAFAPPVESSPAPVATEDLATEDLATEDIVAAAVTVAPVPAAEADAPDPFEILPDTAAEVEPSTPAEPFVPDIVPPVFEAPSETKVEDDLAVPDLSDTVVAAAEPSAEAPDPFEILPDAAAEPVAAETPALVTAVEIPSAMAEPDTPAVAVLPKSEEVEAPLAFEAPVEAPPAPVVTEDIEAAAVVVAPGPAATSEAPDPFEILSDAAAEPVAAETTAPVPAVEISSAEPGALPEIAEEIVPAPAFEMPVAPAVAVFPSVPAGSEVVDAAVVAEPAVAPPDEDAPDPFEILPDAAAEPAVAPPDEDAPDPFEILPDAAAEPMTVETTAPMTAVEIPSAVAEPDTPAVAILPNMVEEAPPAFEAPVEAPAEDDLAVPDLSDTVEAVAVSSVDVNASDPFEILPDAAAEPVAAEPTAPVTAVEIPSAEAVAIDAPDAAAEAAAEADVAVIAFPVAEGETVASAEPVVPEPVPERVVVPFVLPVEPDPAVSAYLPDSPVEETVAVAEADDEDADAAVPAFEVPTDEIPAEEMPAVGAEPAVEAAPANFAHWDTQATFIAWQVAWLWQDWEPDEARDPLEAPCRDAYRRLMAHVREGRIAEAAPKDDIWRNAELSRQALVDYAISLDERPKFLFAEQRNWTSRKMRELQKRDVTLKEIEDYSTYGDVKLAMYKILRSINSDAVAREVKSAMRKGLCEGIARRQQNAITYAYERISRHTWRSLTIDWLGNVSGGGLSYTGLMVKFRDGYLDAPEEQSTAVEAYSEIDSYLRDEAKRTLRHLG